MADTNINPKNGGEQAPDLEKQLNQLKEENAKLKKSSELTINQLKEEIKELKPKVKKIEGMYSIKAKVDGKMVSLDLTKEEIESALSVCENTNMNTVIIMKKHNGAALIFHNEMNAIACQERHGFEYSFPVKKSDLSKFKI